MNSSHVVTPMNTHHHHTTHHPHTTTSSSYSTKMPTSNNNQNTNTIHNYHYTNEQQQQNAALFGSNSINNKSIFSTTTTANAQSSTSTNTNVNNVGAGLSSASTASSSLPTTTTTSTSYKFAPARRLAARQTLRLAIPKQPGDSAQHSHLNSTAPASTGHSNATQFKHSSPSQLPPAPILKRTPVHSTNFSFTPTSSSINSHIPKSASPLESHNLPNVLHHSSTPICTTTSSSGGSSKFLRVRNPSITLSSSDVCNNNDLFAFAKEFSSPAVGGGGEFIN